MSSNAGWGGVGWDGESGLWGALLARVALLLAMPLPVPLSANSVFACAKMRTPGSVATAPISDPSKTSNTAEKREKIWAVGVGVA